METAERIRVLSRKFPDRVVAAILGVDQSDIKDAQLDPSVVPSVGGASAQPVKMALIPHTVEGAGPFTVQHDLNLAPSDLMFGLIYAHYEPQNNDSPWDYVVGGPGPIVYDTPDTVRLGTEFDQYETPQEFLVVLLVSE